MTARVINYTNFFPACLDPCLITGSGPQGPVHSHGHNTLQATPRVVGDNLECDYFKRTLRHERMSLLCSAHSRPRHMQWVITQFAAAQRALCPNKRLWRPRNQTPILGLILFGTPTRPHQLAAASWPGGTLAHGWKGLRPSSKLERLPLSLCGTPHAVDRQTCECLGHAERTLAHCWEDPTRDLST